MSNQKKILIIVTEFPSISETFILNQIVDLKERGYDLTIFSYSNSRNRIVHPLFEKFNLEENTIYHFKNQKGYLNRIIKAINFLTRYFFRISIAKSISLLFKKPQNIIKNIKRLYDFPLIVFKDNFDVVHAHFGFNGKKIADLIEYFTSNPIFIVSFHGSDLTPSKVMDYKRLYKLLFQKANYFTVNSPYLRDIFLKVFPDDQRLIILPESIRVQEMQTYQKPKTFKDTFDMVFCGRLIGWKGPDRAIAIVNLLVQKGYRNLRLHVIGDGELFDSLKKYVNDNHLQEQVIMYGAQPQDQVFQLFSESHIFLLPGIADPNTQRAEAQGLVIQEAQFFKLPVIVSDTGGSKYGFIDQESGFLMPSDATIADYAYHIKYLIDDSKRIQSMGEKGYQFVLQDYDSKVNGEILSGLYCS